MTSRPAPVRPQLLNAPSRFEQLVDVGELEEAGERRSGGAGWGGGLMCPSPTKLARAVCQNRKRGGMQRQVVRAFGTCVATWPLRMPRGRRCPLAHL